MSRAPPKGGGDTDPRTVDRHMAQSFHTGFHRLTVPLERVRGEILGYRFFQDTLRDSLATAIRAKDAFTRECAEEGGALEEPAAPASIAFGHRVLADIAHRDPGAKHRWTGLTALCARGEAILGGFLAAIYDPTASNGIVSALLGRVPTQTAVYAYRGQGIPSSAALQRKHTAELAERERQARDDQRTIAAFRADLAVGSETSCGTVIALRGPVAEVAVPPTATTPNGQPSFWARRDRIYPVGHGPCTFGL